MVIVSRGPHTSAYNLLADTTELWCGAKSPKPLAPLWCHADDSKLFGPCGSSILASERTEITVSHIEVDLLVGQSMLKTC